MPVDIASGKVHLERVDTSIPGIVDLVWERRYDSALLARPSTSLGRGWTCRYFATLAKQPDAFEFVTSTGAIEVLHDPEGIVERGGVVRNLGAFLEIFKTRGRYIVQSWNAETGDIWRYCFLAGNAGENWPLVSIDDVSGRGLDLLRDERGRLIAIQQRLERRTLRLRYNEQALIVAVTFVASTGEQQALATYEYDSTGLLTAAYDALRIADRYEYDVGGRITRELARDGGVFSFRYDVRGRCVRTSGLDLYDQKTLRFSDAAGITEVADSYGEVSSFQHRPDGQITSLLDPLGAETKSEYDEYGRVIARTRPGGATEKYEYDLDGDRSKIIDARDGVFELLFNDTHQVVRLTDPSGNVWRREYDSANRLIRTVDGNGASWAIDYDPDGNPTAVTDPRGAVRRQRYLSGMLAETTDWKGNTTLLETDYLGRVVRRVGPLGKTLVFTYDLLGRPTRVVFPDDGALTASYDTGGNLTRLVDPRGAVTRYRYGSCRRLLQRIDPNGNEINYVWGTEPGQLKQVINEKGETYTFDYDAAGGIIGETSFDGRKYIFANGQDGFCTEVTNGNGEVIRINRDPEGRIVEQYSSDGGFAKFTYDKLGNVVEAVNQDIAVKIERDAVGRVLKETQGEYWVQSIFDRAGNRTRMETSLGHFVDYELDPNGDATRIRTLNACVVESQWDAARREVLRLLPGGLHLEQRYDVSGRLAEQRMGRGTIVPSQGRPVVPDSEIRIRRFYARDAAGVPNKIQDSFWGSTDYTYDPASQLLQSLQEREASEVFEYDVSGNITRISSRGRRDTDEALVYESGDRLFEKAGTRYEYDRQGRLVKKTQHVSAEVSDVWSYTWDALDQLRSVTRPNGEVWEYAYDAFGRRVHKTSLTQRMRFVWDNDVLAHEVTGQGWTGWVFSGSSLAPIAKIEGGNSYPIICDHLGTPREMIDIRGRLVWRHRSLAYGAGVPERNEVRNPFRFQGQYFDEESGLHYNRFRYYDPEVGRFVQQDPFGIVGWNNLYRYAPNPIEWIDPYGLNASCDSGDRGRAKAVKDMKKAGFTVVAEEVTMIVNGQRIRADFVAERNGTLYVFEVKNGTGRLTDNQTASGVFNIANPANQNGGIRTSGGSDPPGRSAPFEVATGNRPAVGDRGDTGTATFGVLHYDGSPGSRS